MPVDNVAVANTSDFSEAGELRLRLKRVQRQRRSAQWKQERRRPLLLRLAQLAAEKELKNA